jgi:hypothetical protein
VYLKVAMLAPQWEAVARFLGRHTPDELTALERLGFFASDLALDLVAIPAVATALVCLARRSYRVPAAFVLSAVVSVAYFVELRAESEVGQYISGDVLRDALGWSFANPSSVADYLTAASLVKLAALLGVLVAIVLAAGRVRRAEARGDRGLVWRAGLYGFAAVVMGGAALLAPVAFAARLPGSALNQSAVGLAVEALVAPALRSDAGLRGSFGDVLAASRRRARTPAIDLRHPWVGRERGADLLVFVMETGPAQALDFAAEGRTLPGAGRLYPRALVAARHHTTHPYSSDALFSVLSGLYPQGRRALLRGRDAGTVNGLFSALPDDVALRGVYLPSLYRIELDDRMYGAFGATTLYVADRHPADPERAAAERRAADLVAEFAQSGGRFDDAAGEALRLRLAADLQALERVKTDVGAAIARGERFAVLFFPEIGHAPWRAIHGDASVLARGHALMALQDRWLAELVTLLERAGRLDRTIIAVTADHGLRTRAEYPDLPVGVLSDVMFHVPLLVYAPRTLDAPFRIDAPTSHVDLAPTLLALLGAPAGAARMQGVPLWQRTGADRLYLLGAAYGGADGFVEDDRYLMRQALSGAVYASPRLAFGPRDQVRPGDPLVPYVTGELEEALRTQRTLAIRLSEHPGQADP